jgi:hypothetical protein
MAIATMTPTGRRTAVRPYRLSIEMAGLLIVLLGAWGGIVPFVGPLFGFSGDGSPAWTWNMSHAMLSLAPGAVAVACGLLVMLAGQLLAGRRVLAFAGLVVGLCGAWFIIGPLAWPVLKGTTFFVGDRPLRELAYWIGYSLGPGSLLVGLGALVLGRPAPAAVMPAVESETRGKPVTAKPITAGPATT